MASVALVALLVTGIGGRRDAYPAAVKLQVARR
jgi:hypothetical protein